MANEGLRRPSCPDTGLAVPECSCPRCLERMLMEVKPTLSADQISIRRTGEAESGRVERREAA